MNPHRRARRSSYTNERRREVSLESYGSDDHYSSNNSSQHRHVGGSSGISHSSNSGTKRKLSRDRSYERNRSSRHESRRENRRGCDNQHHHHYRYERSSDSGSSRSSDGGRRNLNYAVYPPDSNSKYSHRYNSPPYNNNSIRKENEDYRSNSPFLGTFSRSPPTNSYYNSRDLPSSSDSLKSTSDISDTEEHDYHVPRDHSYRSKSTAKSHFVVLKSLAPDCTEDQIEERIRSISIQKGFSLPNSVILDKHPSILQGEATGYVEFPSLDSASRFLKVLGRKCTLFIANQHYPADSPPLRELPKHILDRALQTAATSNASGMRSDFIGYKDWICPLCNYNNFARRGVCGSCGGPRVDHVSPFIPNKGASYDNNNNNTNISTNPSSTILNNTSIPVLPTLQRPPASPNSSWIVLKDISPNESHDSISQEMQKFNFPFQQIHLFQPEQSETSMSSPARGFCFIVFESSSIATKITQFIHSNEIHLWDKAIRVDVVCLREKQAFLDMQVAAAEDVSHCTIGDLERISASHGASSYWKEYVQQWTTRTIYLPDGLPGFNTFILEPMSGYLYSERLYLYYDTSTEFYISLRGDYYVWEEALYSLRRVYTLEQIGAQTHHKNIDSNIVASTLCSYDAINTNPSQNGSIIGGTQFLDGGLMQTNSDDLFLSAYSLSNGGQDTTKSKNDNTSAIASILASAQQVAQASKDTAKAMETVDKKTIITMPSVTNSVSNIIGQVGKLKGKNFAQSSPINSTVDISDYTKLNSASFPSSNTINSLNNNNFKENNNDENTHNHYITRNNLSRSSDRNNGITSSVTNSTINQKDILSSIFQSNEIVKEELHTSLFSNNDNTVKDQDADMIKNETIKDFNSSSLKNSQNDDFLNSNKLNIQSEMFVCYTCIRQFLTEEMLLKHQTFSALHKHNIKKVW